jgi:hypothetical protein
MRSSRSVVSSRTVRRRREIDANFPDNRVIRRSSATGRAIGARSSRCWSARLLAPGLIFSLQQHGQPPAPGQTSPSRRRRRQRQPWSTGRDNKPASRLRRPGRCRRSRPHRREEVIVVIPELTKTSSPRSRLRSVVADSSARTRGRSAAGGTIAALQRGIGSLRLIARGISPPSRRRHGRRHRGLELATTGGADPRLHPLFVRISAFTGAMAISTDSTAGERERGSFEALLVNPAPMLSRRRSPASAWAPSRSSDRWLQE